MCVCGSVFVFGHSNTTSRSVMSVWWCVSHEAGNPEDDTCSVTSHQRGRRKRRDYSQDKTNTSFSDGRHPDAADQSLRL